MNEAYYWKIADGRIWSSETACFVDEAPEGCFLTPLYQNGQPGGLDYLRETIDFYGFDLGALANEEKNGK